MDLNSLRMAVKKKRRRRRRRSVGGSEINTTEQGVE